MSEFIWHKNSFDYVTMYMWIAELPNLSQNEKLVFSKIYNYCKSNNRQFTGSMQYLAQQTAMSIRTVASVLKSLRDKNLIIKDKSLEEFKDIHSYKVNDDEILKLTGLTPEQINKITINSLSKKIKDFENEIEKLKLNNVIDENNSDTDVKFVKNKLILDINIKNENGSIKSSNKKKLVSKEQKNNKFSKFMSYLSTCNYPNSVKDSAVKYVKWLLGNSKITLDQWTMMIDSFNKELKKIPNKNIREEAALSAFQVAYASGYRKLYLDRKYLYNNFSLPDTQVSDSNVKEVAPGVYHVESNKTFVKDSNGEVVTF